MNNNFQEQTWSSEFGKSYTDRNIYDPQALDLFYEKSFGVSRSEMNTNFLGKLELSNDRILEIGCNVGNQLHLLQKMGFKNLFGIELQWYAVEKAKELTRNINIIQGSGDNLPFKDNYFKLVFTSGVLIHISPDNIDKILEEVYRCTSQYIWGFEYYSDNYSQVTYRGNENLLWKTNFAGLYMNKFKDLELIKEEKYKYVNSENVDSMFLLRKRG